MKKKLLLFAGLIIGFSGANAQCTITPSCTPSSVYCTTPSGGSNLPNGTVNSPYSTVIQVSVGLTSGPASINGIGYTGSTLPNGLTISGNPGSGAIAGGGNGCLEILGTPTTAVVDFSVVISFTASTSAGNFPSTVTYLLTIDDPTANITEVNSAELTLFPNPAENKLTLNVNEPTNIKIVNVLGTVVMHDHIQSSKTLNIENLRNGVYFVVNESTGKTIKFIKK